ncbi:hypothetical protein JCGZ_16900 [Jatropha curcas]|uniref:GIY-YIG domain-containing protein n=2 Tax=Jatropha curcas TaxID=180498 RepID=A0A067L8P6_JATCU|nr:hypothetical protein JCGZ_16900 [Jatropha curcas]
MRLLSNTFRSIKPHSSIKSKSSPSPLPVCRISPAKSNSSSRSRSWCVYLILSTNAPIKTYVGVTNNFSRRLKQHNGDLKGGAKASRAGRPWICACLIQGFSDQSEACEFESKWKSLSRKLPRNRKNDDSTKDSINGSHALLQHRQTALSRVKGSLNCSHLDINWKLNPF